MSRGDTVSEASLAARAGQRAPGVEQLFTPGEPEWRKRQESADNIRLEPAVIAMLTRFANELGVAATPFNEPILEKHHA